MFGREGEFSAQKSGRAQVALEAASKKEMVDGDLKAAIESYQKIVAQFGATDRPAVAKALVRMGQCYEKLGSAEARKAYERAVDEYSDQKEVVATAQARLAALATSQRPGLAYRQLWTGPKVDTTGTVFSRRPLSLLGELGHGRLVSPRFHHRQRPAADKQGALGAIGRLCE